MDSAAPKTLQEKAAEVAERAAELVTPVRRMAFFSAVLSCLYGAWLADASRTPLADVVLACLLGAALIYLACFNITFFGANVVSRIVDVVLSAITEIETVLLRESVVRYVAYIVPPAQDFPVRAIPVQLPPPRVFLARSED